MEALKIFKNILIKRLMGLIKIKSSNGFIMEINRALRHPSSKLNLLPKRNHFQFLKLFLLAISSSSPNNVLFLLPLDLLIFIPTPVLPMSAPNSYYVHIMSGLMIFTSIPRPSF